MFSENSRNVFSSDHFDFGILMQNASEIDKVHALLENSNSFSLLKSLADELAQPSSDRDSYYPVLFKREIVDRNKKTVVSLELRFGMEFTIYNDLCGSCWTVISRNSYGIGVDANSDGVKYLKVTAGNTWISLPPTYIPDTLQPSVVIPSKGKIENWIKFGVMKPMYDDRYHPQGIGRIVKHDPPPNLWKVYQPERGMSL